MRYAVFVFITIGQFLLGLAASSVPVSEDDAEARLSSLPTDIDQEGIFSHNLLVSLPSFLPLLGLGWQVLLIWNTGLTVSAIGSIRSFQAPVLWIRVAELPFFWLEIMGFSLAVTAGTMLFFSLLSRKAAQVRHELSRVVITIPPYAAFLWLASQLETSRRDPFLGWLPLVLVGSVAILVYSKIYGPELSRRDWAILVGGFVFIFPVISPIAYVFLVLFLLMYKIWERLPPQTIPT